MVVGELWESAFGYDQFEGDSQVFVYKIDHNNFYHHSNLCHTRINCTNLYSGYFGAFSLPFLLYIVTTTTT